MKRQVKWWMIPTLIILVLLIVAAVFWPALKLYLAPKTVLTAALTDTYSALQQRFEKNPALLLLRTLDMENGNTFAMELTTENRLLGTVQYDMDVQLNWEPRQVTARGQVVSQGKGMDLSVYLDKDFAALSSASILQGNFYGLTYDTFSRDIRANQLLALMIGESTLKDWETNVSDLDEIMSDAFYIPDLPEADLDHILLGILALHPEVDRETLQENGTETEYFVISFETTGQAIQSGLQYLKVDTPITLDADEEVEISFWLQEDRIRIIELEAENREVVVRFGPDILSDDLVMQWQDSAEILQIRIHTQLDTANYQETVTISGAKNMELAYRWNTATGDLQLNRTQEGESDGISANLTPSENGIRIETADFSALMHLLIGTRDNSDTPCTLIVTKGADIQTPAYKNFSEWSLEDLITLLGGIGSLFGLKMA